MTAEELYEGKALPEIDDLRHAQAIMNKVLRTQKEARVFGVAEMLAQLREYYVEIGKQLKTID